MPKVYEQQVSWQATNTQKMRYDALQDFISPALERANQSTQQAMEALRQIGDKQAASELEQAARDSAAEIENWQDFSEPEKTQDKMVASAMEKYDKVMASLDPATRNRINMYNPKSREIYELKAKEKASDVSYDYAYKEAVTNLDSDVGRLINESNPENPETVKAAVDNHLDKMRQTMRPRDFLTYSKSVKSTAEKGLVDWYVAHGDLNKALATMENDKYTGDVNESIRASYIKAIKKAQKDGEDTDVEGANMVDTLVHMRQSPQYAYAVMSELTSSIEQGYEPNKELIEKYGNLPLAGGYSYYQLMNMDYTKAVGIIDKNAKAAGKSMAFQSEARMAFVPLMTEWARITKTDTETKKTVVKDGADINQLKSMYNNFVQHGYDRLLNTTQNSDLVKTLDEISDVVNKEKTAQSMAFDMIGQNMSSVFNSPTFSQRFSVPQTPEEANNWNDLEKQQQVLNTQKALSVAGAYDSIHSSLARRVLDSTNKSKGTKKYEDMRSDLKQMLQNKEITEQRYKELSNYLYGLSEGKASVAFPCLTPDTSTRAWNQCMANYGFGSVNDSAEYNKQLDRGMHETSAWLRDNSIRKYDSGTVGDIYQVLLSEINMALKIPGNAQYYGVQNPGVFTGTFMATIMSDLESKRLGELDNLVDLTNNSNLYEEKGGEYENISWDPANPSPEVATDITKSKQYQLIGDIEEAFSLRLGTNIKFNEDQKKKLAIEIRQISSGKRRSVSSDTSEADRKQLTNSRVYETTKMLLGAKK